jgi:hypothetical protein
MMCTTLGSWFLRCSAALVSSLTLSCAGASGASFEGSAISSDDQNPKDAGAKGEDSSGEFGESSNEVSDDAGRDSPLALPRADASFEDAPWPADVIVKPYGCKPHFESPSCQSYLDQMGWPKGTEACCDEESKCGRQVQATCVEVP